ncbi:hypothetical protein EJB05_57758, partial [Eragrostis curvula]
MEACEMDWRPIPALPLEDLLPDLSVEEQVRVQSKLREEERIRKRFESRAYDARKGGEFDVVKSFMESTVHFKGEVWYHINFWARSRSSSKIKGFFAEVHYKRPASNSVRSDLPIRIPIDQLLARSSVYSDQPEAEVHNRQSASRFVCSDQPVPVPEAETHDMPPSSSSVWPVLHRIPIVEVCTIIGRRTAWKVQKELRILSWPLGHFAPKG